MNPYNFCLLCFGFCSLLLGLLVWLRRHDEIGNKYLMLSICYAGWAIFIAINLSQSANYEWALFTGRLSNGIAAFIPPVWYHFVLTFIKEKDKHARFTKFLYGISFAIFCFVLSPWFIPKVVPRVGFEHYLYPGPVFHIFTFLFFTAVPLSFFELFKKIKKTSGYEHQQLVGLFWTAFMGYLGGSLTFLPIYEISFPQYGLFLMPFYPFVLAYVMIKQKLFDVSALADAIQTAKLTALGVIAASINHEIRNPLFVIKGLAEILAERVVDPLADKEQVFVKAKEIADKTIAQSDRALGIIKSFSSYAKRETDKVYEKQRVRVKEVVEHILPFVESELSLKRITISQDISEGLEAFVDVQSLEEIFINLIVNACQAMPGGGEIKIGATMSSPSLSRGERNGVRGCSGVIITIQDTGFGIPKEQLVRIFEPFYTTKASGTGLGLYVVKQLVEKNGGRVEVLSKKGLGTTFTLIFLQ